jgi:hypothetical protein
VLQLASGRIPTSPAFAGVTKRCPTELDVDAEPPPLNNCVQHASHGKSLGKEKPAAVARGGFMWVIRDACHTECLKSTISVYVVKLFLFALVVKQLDTSFRQDHLPTIVYGKTLLDQPGTSIFAGCHALMRQSDLAI